MGLLPELDPSNVLVLHCPICAFHSHLLSRIEDHFDSEHPQETVDFAIYRCSVCHKVASSRSFLQEHLSLLHPAAIGGSSVHNGGGSDTENLASAADGIVTYFSGKLYSKSRHSESTTTPNSAASPTPALAKSKPANRCIFCMFSTPSLAQLQRHYILHGIQNLYLTTPESAERADTTTEEFVPDTAAATGARVPEKESSADPELMEEDVSVEGGDEDFEEAEYKKEVFHEDDTENECSPEGGLNLSSRPNTNPLSQAVSSGHDLFKLLGFQHPSCQTTPATTPHWYPGGGVATVSPLGHLISSPILSSLQSQFSLSSLPLLSAFSAAGVGGGNHPPPLDSRLSMPTSSSPSPLPVPAHRPLVSTHPLAHDKADTPDLSCSGPLSPEGSCNDSSNDFFRSELGKAVDLESPEEPGMYTMRKAVGMTRTNLPFPARKKLFNWLVDHLREPYPSEEEKLRLAVETGLSRTTVNNWFINARRRYVKPLQQGRLVLQSGVFKTVAWQHNNGSGEPEGGPLTPGICSSSARRVTPRPSKHKLQQLSRTAKKTPIRSESSSPPTPLNFPVKSEADVTNTVMTSSPMASGPDTSCTAFSRVQEEEMHP